MALPDLQDPLDRQELRELLERRARRVLPDFQVPPELREPLD